MIQKICPLLKGIPPSGSKSLSVKVAGFKTYIPPPYAPFFDSRDMPVRALAIKEKEKLIGSRDGLFYIDEENHRYKSFKVPQLRSNMIFSCLYYQNEYYIGTYGGGMYVLNPA